ncbi:succinate dehydrogenase assembly factor 4, mitochondrial-like [Phlebotomus papatasi]|uniref:succinate dehydrogenase assembly factor 4, mitochondrial-like n=1 Tax=Phlebotomus papatasi TaxID=29031 RepID=UPI002483B14B|nr:succinate dehydrogenase assembly factor 4, mitochondrial-like [Phlebotomus papatasi]
MNKIIFSAKVQQVVQRSPLLHIKFGRNQICLHSTDSGGNGDSLKKKDTPRLDELRKKLREKTPIESLDQEEAAPKEDNAFPPFPNNTNPETGEVGGPRGPEPTRYGDWERKGRVSDF